MTKKKRIKAGANAARKLLETAHRIARDAADPDRLENLSEENLESWARTLEKHTAKAVRAMRALAIEKSSADEETKLSLLDDLAIREGS